MHSGSTINSVRSTISLYLIDYLPTSLSYRQLSLPSQETSRERIERNTVKRRGSQASLPPCPRANTPVVALVCIWPSQSRVGDGKIGGRSMETITNKNKSRQHYTQRNITKPNVGSIPRRAQSVPFKQRCCTELSAPQPIEMFNRLFCGRSQALGRLGRLRAFHERQTPDVVIPTKDVEGAVSYPSPASAAPPPAYAVKLFFKVYLFVGVIR